MSLKVKRRSVLKGVTAFAGAAALPGLSLEKALAQLSVSSKAADAKGELKRTVCTVNCTSRCSLDCHIQNGRITSITPAPLPGRPEYSNTCLRGMSLAWKQNSTQRVMYPMLRVGPRGTNNFKRISWDEANEIIVKKIRESTEKYGSKSLGFFTMTGNLAKFAWESVSRFAGTVEGTSFSAEAIMSDHGASMGMQLVYGQQRGGHDARDYMNAKMLILWGRNIADTHTSEMRYVIDARQNGTKVIVIDPRFCSSAAMADEWIPIRPGADTALALGMMSYIISKDMHDKDWLTKYSCGPLLVKESDGQYLRINDKYCVIDSKTKQVSEAGSANPILSGSIIYNGEKCSTSFALLEESLKQYTLKWTSEHTDIDASVIERLSRDYATMKPSAIRMGQGMQRVYNSHSPFRTVATLAAVCGYIGVKGGGASHMGGTSYTTLQPGLTTPLYNTGPWGDTGKYKATPAPGITLYDMAVSKKPNALDFLWIASSNFVNQSPDVNRIVNDVFPNISFIVHADPYWTWTAQYADLVLPTTNQFENWDFVERSPWILIQRPLVTPPGESRSDIQIFSALAKLLGRGEHWENSDEEWVKLFVDSKHPALEGLTWPELVRTGIFTRKDANFAPANPFMDKKFRTATTRFEFYSERLKPVKQELPVYTPPLEDPKGPMAEKYPLVFIQFHDRLNVHSQHFTIPALSVVSKEPWVEINPEDAANRNIMHGDMVKVFNDRGHCVIKAFISEGIIPGTVAIPQGWPPEAFQEGHYQMLTHLTINPAEMLVSESNFAAYDNLVEVVKA